jgi:hypothetical protein
MKRVWEYYPCKVEFEKYFLSGLLEGATIVEKMGFVSWDDACDWAGKATMNPQCHFVVTEMTNLETGEKEYF